MFNSLKIHIKNTAKQLCFLCLFFFPFDVLSSDYQLELATSYQYFHYQEYSQVGDTLNTESGKLTGGVFKFIKNLTLLHQVGIKYKYLSGLVEYDGFTQSLSKHKTKTQEAITEKEIAYWYHGLSDFYSLGISLGVGRWSRKIQPANGVLGLNEKYKWKNMSFNQAYCYSNFLFIGGISYLSEPSVKVDLTEINRGVEIVGMPDGIQIDAKVNYIFPLTDSFGLNVNWLLQWRYFERSKATGSLVEPENELFSSGLELGFKYTF